MQVSRHHAVLTVLLLFELWTSSDCAEESKKRRHEPRHRPGTSQPDFRWDVWADWSTCSVDCGTGITSRSRQCRSMTDGQKTQGCEGLGKEIKLCSIEDCIGADEADAACRELDNNEYGGRRYTWKPYKDPRSECGLACSAVGHGFSLGLSRNVTDGTACIADGTNICVQGVCKALGCDGIVDSRAVMDTCGVCAGDNSTCKPVTKSFTDSVKYGYHTIGKIPKGASNIIIKEVKPSRNYLGLKSKDETFTLNTDFRLSRFGVHTGAGTLWTYARRDGDDCPGECIRADGPTDSPLDVVVLFYTTNKGIQFSYNIDKDSALVDDVDVDPSDVVLQSGSAINNGNEEEDKQNSVKENRPIFSHDFIFRKNGSRRHSRRRHRGRNRTRNHRNRDANRRDNDRRDRMNEVARKSKEGYPGRQVPTVDEGGDTKSETSAATDDGASGQQAQNIEKTPTSTETKGDAAVAGAAGAVQVHHTAEKPVARIAEDDFGGAVYLNEAMDRDKAELSTGVSAEESGRTGPAVDSDINVGDMYANDNRITSLYSWRVAGYSDCSATCGEGKQSPSLECIVTDKRTAVADTYCADVRRPDFPVLACNYGTCPPSWQARPWGKCSVSCGQGVQSRDNVCVRNDGAELNSRECSAPRPTRQDRSCDVGSCAMGWYFTAWPEKCPAMCGDGRMTRKVHCVSDTGNVAAACPSNTRPADDKTCSTDQCSGYWFTGPWSECNATCGMAFQTRNVVCVNKQRGTIMAVVPDSSCHGEERPSTYMSCDLADCGPQWYMNDWSQCSVTCGAGEKSRDVRCIDKDGRPKSGCDPRRQPGDRESCKNRACPSKDQGVSKDDGACADTFTQCSLVLQARLCQYPYYKRRCCESCSMVDAL